MQAALKPADFTIEASLEQPRMVRLAPYVGGVSNIAKTLYPMMQTCFDAYNIKSDTDTVVQLCIDLVEKFIWETVTDLWIIIDRLRINYYSEVKIYGAINMQVLSDVARLYLGEKYRVSQQKYNGASANNEDVKFSSRRHYLMWAQEGLDQQDEIRKMKDKKLDKHLDTYERIKALASEIGKIPVSNDAPSKRLD